MPTLASLTDLPANSNVVPLRLRFLPRHREYLMRWLEAGISMGLCDVDVSPRTPVDSPVILEHVTVWVRENADPAYVIRPDGMRWLVIDHLRDHRLGSFASFEAALSCIRPVLGAQEIVAA
ncbi:hypothetical protein NFI95_08370 [Acetobacteraceae bacterium KSS8]|uniref:Uncharacterized protein n=1 Tax=Endosaccharibacter trunci TaxID=2812733 RepID=A0ABT1W6G0_9PROT|nr:hypothetical protein [Acetobacteraceae bacterium KSS8]